MSLHIIEAIEAELAKLKTTLTPARKVVENDLKEIEAKAVDYIKANGLQDAYQLALTLLTGLTGSPWGAVLATLESQALAMGKALLKGEAAIVAAQAQADLIAAGKLLPPAVAPAAA